MIHIRSAREIELIRASCQIVADALDLIEGLIEPGIRTLDLDREVERLILRAGGKPSFKGRRGSSRQRPFPSSVCISIDREVVHGIPGERRLEKGQAVSMDVGVLKDGYHGDGARTFVVDAPSEEQEHLLKVTREALYKGIDRAVVGSRLGDVSHAIQSFVEAGGCSVVRDLVGHGIGRELWEEPQIPNFGESDTGPRLRPGMVLAIEPMVNLGGYEVRTLDDDWTVVTADGSPSAHFEHTVAVTNGRPDILTLRPETSGASPAKES